MSLFDAILWGPAFLPAGLWFWAYRHAQSRAARHWLLLEACIAVVIPILGFAIGSRTPALLFYCVLVIVGSWVYPLLTVHLPHRDYGPTPLTQTGTLRGRIIPAIFLELTYHLEHHLYPQVPAHRLPELSCRLDPGPAPRRSKAASRFHETKYIAHKTGITAPRDASDPRGGSRSST